MDDGLGGGGLGGGGLRAVDGGGMDGVDAEKDKMLVEKQKVIEELTWKLHQEQRQVRNQLTKNKSRGSSQLSNSKIWNKSWMSPANIFKRFFCHHGC